MEIRNLLTFTKVAEVKSLSKVAKQLGYAQSTVTMQMQQLEQELGVSIYERAGRQIRITQEGQELLKYAVSIVRMSEEALRIGQDDPEPVRGLLRLGVIDLLTGDKLARQLHYFAKTCPEVKLEVHGAPDSRTLISKLLKSEIDMMVTLDHYLSDPLLVHVQDETEQVYFVTAPDYPLAYQKNLRLEQILKEPLIRGKEDVPYGQILGQCQDDDNSRLVIQSHLLAVKMALRQDGVLLAPDSLVREYIEDGRLVVLDCRVPGGEWLIQTIYHKKKGCSTAMNAWSKMLREKKWQKPEENW